MTKLSFNLTIKHKLILTIAIVLTAIIVMFFFQTSSNTKLGDIVEKMHKHPLTVTRNSTLAYAESLQVGVYIRELNTSQISEKEQNELMKAIRDNIAATKQHQQVVNERILGEEGKQLAAKASKSMNSWALNVEKMLTENRLTKETFDDFEVLEQDLSTVFKQIVDYAKEKGDGFYTSSVDSIENSRMISFMLFVAATLFIILVAWQVFASIIGSLNLLKHAIEEIERDSDLSGRVNLESNCEVGVIAKGFNTMMVKIEQTVLKGLQSAKSITVSNQEFTSQTNAISASASNQSDKISKVAHIISDISRGIQTVAANADTTSSKVEQANKVASHSNMVVKEMAHDIRSLATSASDTTNMVNQLKQDTDNIDSILEVISTIAEQTNLLALNAAIEAARAGEQGRGFAVVADEVRNLAERTTESTKEIHDTIQKLQAGTDTVVNAINAYTQMIDSSVTKAESVTVEIAQIHALMDQVSNMNTDIAAGTHSQATDSENADKLIQNISILSHETKQNAVNIKQRNAELLELSKELNYSMQQFKVS